MTIKVGSAPPQGGCSAETHERQPLEEFPANLETAFIDFGLVNAWTAFSALVPSRVADVLDGHRPSIWVSDLCSA
jgi:hypothetical protein